MFRFSEAVKALDLEVEFQEGENLIREVFPFHHNTLLILATLCKSMPGSWATLFTSETIDTAGFFTLFGVVLADFLQNCRGQKKLALNNIILKAEASDEDFAQKLSTYFSLGIPHILKSRLGVSGNAPEIYPLRSLSPQAFAHQQRSVLNRQPSTPTGNAHQEPVLVDLTSEPIQTSSNNRSSKQLSSKTAESKSSSAHPGPGNSDSLKFHPWYGTNFYGSLPSYLLITGASKTINKTPSAHFENGRAGFDLPRPNSIFHNVRAEEAAQGQKKRRRPLTDAERRHPEIFYRGAE